MILNPNTVPIPHLPHLQLNRLIESLEDHFVTFLSYVSPNAFHIPEILYIRTRILFLPRRPPGPDPPALPLLSLAVGRRAAAQLRLLRLLAHAESPRGLSAARRAAVAREPPLHKRGGQQPEGRAAGLSGAAGAAEAPEGGGGAAGGAAGTGGRGTRAAGDRQCERAPRERTSLADAATRRRRQRSQEEALA